MKRIAVLASGRVVLVLSDCADAPVLEKAKKAGVKALFIDPKNHSSRESYDQALVDVLKAAQVDLVVLAGFMRLVSPLFVRSFPMQILNIHPSLLPSFPGTDGIEQALAHGAKVTGCTVHFVDEGLDSGPIVLQEAVPVIQRDTVHTLRSRVQAVEHRLYPTAIDLFCRGMLKVEGRRCYILD